MAALHEVEEALVALVAQAAYPAGTGAASAAGAPVKIFRGWPDPAQLDADLAAGTLTVTVYPSDNESRVTRHMAQWFDLPTPTPALTLTASGTTVTVAGTPSSPLNAAVLVDGKKAYVYAVQPGDTLTAVATGLAALVNADTAATSSGAVATVPSAKRLTARVGSVGTSVRETKRQKRGLQITLWCPTPQSRDTLAALIETALAEIDYLSLPDGTGARLLYEKTGPSDRAERDGIYRRDLFYSAEYSTTKSQAVARIVAELLNTTAVSDFTPAPITTVTTATAT